MLHLVHLLIVALYLAGPPVAVWHAIRAYRKDRRRLPLRRLRRAVVGGTAVGLLVCIAFAIATHFPPPTASTPLGTTLLNRFMDAVAHGAIRADQVAITAYLATSFILLLGWFDRGLWLSTQSLFRLKPGSPPGRWFGSRVTGALLLRAALVAGVGIPYVLAVALTYRPKQSPAITPADRPFGWSYEPITFPAAVDRTRIAGWWIPANEDGPSDRTVLLCPDSVGGPAAALPLVRGLRDDGYNVLTFDFRGHGDSAGQLISFGDLERRDVLGAVQWLQAKHPGAAQRVVGLGVSTGAAALLAAAADPAPAGQAIDAVAVYAPYDRLDRVVASTLHEADVPRPLAWLVEHIALPMADLQVGTAVSAFAPADAAANLWPRPVLVVHGMNDEVIPFAQGQAVYNAASEPKQCLFIGQAQHGDSLRSDEARRTVEEYFKAARRMM